MKVLKGLLIGAGVLVAFVGIVFMILVIKSSREADDSKKLNGWTWNETTNAITDARTLMFYQSSNSYGVKLGMLYFSDSSGKGAWFWSIYRERWDSLDYIAPYPRDIKVTYRFGKTAPITETFKLLNRGTLACQRPAVSTSDTLAVQVSTDIAAISETIFEFDLNGLSYSVAKYNKQKKAK